MSLPNKPFLESSPSEVPLKNPPLVRVIAQIQFPLIASIEKMDFIAGFQEEIRRDYPNTVAEKIHNIAFGSDSPLPPSQAMIWRFKDKDNKWRVSLAPHFIAIETLEYKSRDDFFERFGKILVSLKKQIDPGICNRIGIRYINRIAGKQLENIENLVNSKLLGVLKSDLKDSLTLSINHSLFQASPTAKMSARWGLLCPGQTIDVAALEAIQEKSWVLDFDMFSEEETSFEPAKLISEAHSYAEKIYAFFRWSVKEEFLIEYGGEV